MDALRDYLNEKIGWNREKFNSVVAPVLERFKSKDVLHLNITRIRFQALCNCIYLLVYSARRELIRTSH